MGYRTFDHTADIGLEAWGKDLPELFSQAARGMFDVAVEVETVRPKDPHVVTVRGDDVEMLFREWLSELLYFFSAKGLVFSTFDFHKLSETELDADAYGEKFDDERHHLKTDIKAVTYHQLSVERRDDGWVGRVILDL